MKICIVSLNIVPYFLGQSDAAYGGAEIQAAALARTFNSRGMDVSLVVSNLDKDITLPYRAENAFFSNQGVRGIRFFHPRLSGILRALDRADADIYYQRCAGMITGITALFCRRKRRIFIYGIGSNSDFFFTKTRAPFLRDKLLYYMGLKLADGVIAQNQLQRELSIGRLKKPARVIPNIIDMDGTDELSSGEKVLWIGTLRKIKGPELFLQLARRFPEREFVMIGGGGILDIDYGMEVRRRAEDIPNLICTGRIPHTEVNRYLRNAAVLVNTSSIEGFPNAFLEAWKCGVPVVSFIDVDGLIEKERVGDLCSDMEDMEKKIRSLLEDPERRASIGKRAKTLVSTNYSPAAVSDKYMTFFEELLKKKR